MLTGWTAGIIAAAVVWHALSHEGRGDAANDHALRCAQSVTHSATAWAQELPLRETPQGKLFGTERFSVRLEPQTGWVADVLCDGKCVVQAADSRQFFDLKQEDAWVTGRGTAIEGLGVERISPDTIASRMRADDWLVDAYVQLFPDKRMLRRWFQITWKGTAETKVKGFWFQSGRLTLGDDGGYSCPAQYPPRRVGAEELVAGRKTHNSRSPYPVVAENGDGWSAIWLADESPDYSDRGSSGVNEGEGSIRVTQSFNMLGRMRRGVTHTVGDGWLWVQPNDAETALRRMHEWFRFVKQVPPADRPDWLKRVILYSFHPGGTIGSQCRDLGGFRAATDFLPHIRSLGCNAIWLMPLEDKSIYWPRDYYKFQEGLGTPEEYKALTAKAHGLGMRVWQDCVPHGGSNEYPRAKEHPEWLAQNKDGSTLHYWCFDFNWPTWIDYMSDVASFYTREYGLDGFRIDACGGSKIPNWNPAIPYARASHAQAQGGLAMQRALRRAVKDIRPDGANLAEVGASIHGTVSDSTYDFSLCYHVLHDFRKVPASVFVPRLRRWLHEQQCSEVPDLVRMRHLESHDSLRSGLWYGAQPQRALMALISWIHGIPMVYHEMEDGNFDVFRRIFHVRSHVTELNSGTADYLSVTAPDGVFACLRTGTLPKQNSPAWHTDYAWDTSPKTSERASISLVNLNAREVSRTISLPLDCLPETLRGVQAARDLFSGKNLPVHHSVPACEIPVTLPPFGYTVLRLGSETLPPPFGAEKEQTISHETRTEKAPSPLQLKTDAGTLIIDPDIGLASAWLSDGRVMAATMDLALPADLVKTGVKTVCRQTADDVVTTKQFGSRTLKFRYSRSADDGVDVHASWEGGVPEGAAIVFDVPDAVTWQAQTAEWLFASPFRVRHPGCDGVIGSIYRLPQGTAVTWDSRLHPFGLSSDQAWVGVVSAEATHTGFAFDPQCLPARVHVLDRVGESHGMKVLMAWRNTENGAIIGGDELRFRLTDVEPKSSSAGSTGDERLRLVGGGWEFENSHLRARVARTGALTGLWRKDAGGWRQILRHGGMYTDKGFGNGVRYAQENDVEATVRIERRGSDVRLSVCGTMRGFGRFDKMAHPVHFYSAYTFGDGPTFRYACAVKPETVSTAKYAFLSLLLRTEAIKSVTLADANGTFLKGEREGSTGRFAQTAQSENPARLPSDIRLLDAHDVTLRLGNLAWFGAKPDNVFMHGDDLHLAWMDGKPDNGGVGHWNGLTCSIACEDTMDQSNETPPLVLESRAELLKDGGFEMSDTPNVVLLSSGLSLRRGGTGHSAWSLPPGAEYKVTDGSRCVIVDGDGESYRLIRQSLPVCALKTGSKWRLSARMKGVGIQRSDMSWKTACLRWAVSAGGRTTYTTTSLPWGHSDWQIYDSLLTVPENAERVTVEAGMNGNKGQVWIDDVRVYVNDTE